MERGFVALFERKVLFRIARFVAFSICFLLFLSLIAGGIYLVMTGKEGIKPPDPVEVATSLKPVDSGPYTETETSQAGAAPTAPQLNSSVLRGIKVPPVLQELLLTEDNQRVFKGWLDDLPEEERQVFIDGVSNAITAGRMANVEDAEVINAFHGRFAAYITEKQAAEALAKTEQLYVAGAFVSTLMLLALFSLVLVLLAIERNTRAAPEASPA